MGIVRFNAFLKPLKFTGTLRDYSISIDKCDQLTRCLELDDCTLMGHLVQEVNVCYSKVTSYNQ